MLSTWFLSRINKIDKMVSVIYPWPVGLLVRVRTSCFCAVSFRQPYCPARTASRPHGLSDFKKNCSLLLLLLKDHGTSWPLSSGRI